MDWDSIRGWSALIGVTLTLTGVILKLLWNFGILREINAVASAVRSEIAAVLTKTQTTHDSCTKLTQQLTDHERRILLVEGNVLGMSNLHGQIQTQLKEIEDDVEKIRSNREQNEASLQRDLGGIQAKLGVLMRAMKLPDGNGEA